MTIKILTLEKKKLIYLTEYISKTNIYTGWPQNLESWKNLESDNLG